ncbi:MAG: YfhO family protein, partial [Bacteroidota bacterium]
EVPFQMTEADRVILNNETALHYRVLDFGQQNPYNENRAGYFHKSLGGYHAAKLSRFEDVKNGYLGGNGQGPKQNILNALNVRWVIYPPQEQGQGPFAMPNADALGNAWLVRRLEVVSNARSEFDSLGAVNLAQVAVIDQSMAGDRRSRIFVVDSNAFIRLISYAPDTMRYEYSNSSASLAVFSEVFYAHGWNAYIDGQLVPHLRVNYLLRGLELPAGEHKIEFRFEPATYTGGEKISLAFNLALLAVVGLATWKGLRPTASTSSSS